MLLSRFRIVGFRQDYSVPVAHFISYFFLCICFFTFLFFCWKKTKSWVVTKVHHLSSLQ